MKFTLISLAVLFFAFTQADLPPVPNCSASCLLTTLSSDGCASLDDFKCHCSKPQLASQIDPCVAKACDATDAANVTATIDQTCASVGEPVPSSRMVMSRSRIAREFTA
ncbi:MAG: hypothetical protein M1838_005509 [Thelocarpon superellum]|nr:MAG: hypothetical protein M1838_005509 [Thelocarpon superellum]